MRNLKVAILLLLLNGCAIYEARYFEPNGSDIIEVSNGWYAEVSVEAYTGSLPSGPDENQDFFVNFNVYHLDGKVAKEVKFKELKLYFEQGLSPIVIQTNIQTTHRPSNNMYYSSLGRRINIPAEVKNIRVQINVVIEEENGGELESEFSVSMKRKEINYPFMSLM